METLRKYNEMALLTGLALILFVIEMQVPPLVSLPGVKMGLANVVTVYAVYRFRAEEAVLILLARILLTAFFAGQAAAFLYSLCGGLFCITGMLLLKRLIPARRLWLSSVCGAVLHNGGQVAAAAVMTGTSAVLAYFPVLAAAGCAAGLFTGLCAQQALSHPALRRGCKGMESRPNKLKKIDLID